MTKWFTKDEVWEVVIIAAAVGVFLLLFGGVARAAETEAMVKLTHGSDLARGCPFRCDEQEPQYDALTGGVTITAGKRERWEIDITHGFKWIDRGPRENGSEFSVRFYPMRRR